MKLAISIIEDESKKRFLAYRIGMALRPFRPKDTAKIKKRIYLNKESIKKNMRKLIKKFFGTSKITCDFIPNRSLEEWLKDMAC